jgi:ketosteroid isomerase-like protein
LRCWMDQNPPPFPGLASGREGLKQIFCMFQQATPGTHRIEEQIADGDKVVIRLTSIGKHEGDLTGAPRTGNDLKMTSITIHRIANGEVVRKRCAWLFAANRSHTVEPRIETRQLRAAWSATLR